MIISDEASAGRIQCEMSALVNSNGLQIPIGTLT